MSWLSNVLVTVSKSRCFHRKAPESHPRSYCLPMLWYKLHNSWNVISQKWKLRESLTLCPREKWNWFGMIMAFSLSYLILKMLTFLCERRNFWIILSMRKLLNYFKYEMISINFYFTIMTKVALQSVSLFFGLPRGEN